MPPRTRSPRTVHLERVAHYLLNLSPFVSDLEAFRFPFGVPSGGFSRAQCEGYRGALGRPAHEFWGMFLRVFDGRSVDAGESQMVEGLGFHPLGARCRAPSRQKLQELGFDLALLDCLESELWISKFVSKKDGGGLETTEEAARCVDCGRVGCDGMIGKEPASQPMAGSANALEYEGLVETLLNTYRQRVPAFGRLEEDESRDLLCDLIYQPGVLVERLARDYRVLDAMQGGMGADWVLVKTFTTLYPDITLEFAEARAVDSSGQERPVAREYQIRSRPGIPGREMKAFSEEVMKLFRAESDATRDMRRLFASRNRDRKEILRYVQEAAKIDSGASPVEVVRALADEMQLERQEPVGEDLVHSQFKAARRAGFAYLPDARIRLRTRKPTV